MNATTIKIAFIVFICFSLPCTADEPAHLAKADFELLPSKHMAVQIKINGKGPYRVLFDTGSPVVLLSNRIARESGVIRSDSKPSVLNLFATMGQFSIRSIEMGTLKAEKIPAIVMDHPTLAEAVKVLGPLEGIVGFPLFARYRMTIDYAASELSFVPNGFQPPDVLQDIMNQLMQSGAPKAPTVLAPAGQWGVTASKTAEDRNPGVVVTRVQPNSAAAAELQVADRLLTVDGRWTDSVDDLYRAVQTVRPGTHVAILLRRKDREMTVEISPRMGL